MSEAKRWTASLTVDWHPVLTFTRRRSTYLDWLDENCIIAGFRDEDEFLGVAIGSPYQRIEVQRDGFKVKLLDPEANVQSLASPLAGLGECFDPRHPLLKSYRARWSCPIQGTLEETATRVARRAIPLESVILLDCAILADLRTNTAEMQIEYGVVDLPQLVFRLTNADAIRTVGPSDGIGDESVVELDGWECALFVDVYWRPSEHLVLGAPEALLEHLTTIEKQVSAMVTELAVAL